MKISSVVPEFSPISAHCMDSSTTSFQQNSRPRLRFPDPAIELDFQDFLTRTGFLPETDLYLALPFATAAISSLAGFSYVYDSLSEEEFSPAAQYQLCGLGACMVLGMAGTVAAYRYRRRRTVEIGLWTVLWLASSFWFSLLSTSVLSSLVSSPSETQALPGAVPILLMHLLMIAVFPCKSLAYAFISLTSLLIYTAVNFCVQTRPRVKVVIEFLLLLIVSLLSLYVMFRFEKAVRRAFVHETAFEKANRYISGPPVTSPISPARDVAAALASIHTVLTQAVASAALFPLRSQLLQALSDVEFCSSHLLPDPIPSSEASRKANLSSSKLADPLSVELPVYKEEPLAAEIDAEDKEFLRQNCMQSKASEFEKQSDIAVPVAVSIDSWAAEYQLNELQAMLNQLGKNWNFDMFFLQEITNGKALSVSGRFSLLKYDLNTKYGIADTEAEAYFAAIEGKYKPNPYHNSCHGADVMNSTLYLLLHSDLATAISSLEMLGLVIGTLCHDVGHGALNNRFLVNSRDSLAITYNDQSVLEMMHASVAYSLLQQESTNILKNLDNDSWMLVRKVVLRLILATGIAYSDMSRHFDLLKEFKASHSAILCTDVSNLDERIRVLEVCIKAADIGHAAKKVELHEKWTFLICEEFFQQGDLEKKLGLPVSTFCDRDNTNIPKVRSKQAQIGFIQNIVLPLYEALNVFVGSKDIEEMCVEQLRANMGTWERLHKRKRRFTHLPGDSEETRPVSDFEALAEKVRGLKRG